MILQMTNPVQGALRQERKLELIANHIANADTNGFKADQLTFDQELKVRMQLDTTPGDLKVTNNPLDVGIAGDGFFKVQTAQGVRYTRNGNFMLNAENMLVTANGEPVLGDGGEIYLEGGEVAINEAGEIFVDGQLLDKLSIAAFRNPERLKKEGAALLIYEGDDADVIVPETLQIQQGALERSNVSIVQEMTRMIETMRTFEAFQKMIQSYDETDAKVISEVGRT